LHALTGETRWNTVADNAKRRARAELLMDGERALRKPGTLTPVLRDKLLARAGDRDFDRLIRMLGLAPPEPLSVEQKKRYTEALAKALSVDPDKRQAAALLADIAGRSEAAGVFLKLL